MARRKTKTRYKTRTVYKKAPRRRSSKKNDVHLLDFEAMGYGAIREWASNLLRQASGQIPMIGDLVTNYGDEVLMGTADYLIAKNMKGKTKAIAMKGLIVENARVGANLSENVPLPSFGTSATTTTQGSTNGLIIVG